MSRITESNLENSTIAAAAPAKRFQVPGSRGIPAKSLLGDVFGGRNDDFYKRLNQRFKCTQIGPEKGLCGGFPYVWACVVLI